MGLDALWFIGDNFMAETYRKYFRKNEDHDWFVKENFEVTGFCSSKYSDSNSNMLSRIINSYAYALNETKLFKLPKFIVVVLDDDLIQYLGFVGKGTTCCYGEWLEYIVKNMLDMTKIRLASLPKKAVKTGYPQLYFVVPPHHAQFTDNKARTRVASAMEVVCKEFTEVCIIRMKEIWNYGDKSLVDSHGYLTHQGLQTYWYSVDSAMHSMSRNVNGSWLNPFVMLTNLTTTEVKRPLMVKDWLMITTPNGILPITNIDDLLPRINYHQLFGKTTVQHVKKLLTVMRTSLAVYFMCCCLKK